MTTDLTDGSELNEEEFDWDVFAPDPDESEIAANAAVEGEDDLNLDDDADLDWEAAWREPEVADGVDSDARAGAAYERIVDTVRRSVEDPERETPVAQTPVVGAPVVEGGGDEGGGGGVDEESSVAIRDPDAAGATEVSWLDLDDDRPDDDGDAPALGPFESGQETSNEPERGPWVPVSTMTPFEPLTDADAQETRRFQDAPSWQEPEVGWESAWEPDPEPQAPAVPAFEPDPATALATPAWTNDELEAEVDVAPPVTPVLPEAAEDVIEPDQASAPKLNRRERKKALQPKDGARQPRSRVFTATVVVACLVLVFLAGVVAVRTLRHPGTTNAAAKTAPPTAHSSSFTDAARIQSATDAVDSATTAAQVGLTSLADIPTPSTVAKVISPYIASLQLYESVLAGGDVPPSARATAASASAQVRHELSFLDTISNLSPAQLGAYLQQFGTEATHLQATLGALERELTTAS